MDKYSDRKEAGKLLAEHLKQYGDRNDVIVLGLPRGGVPIAYEIANALNVKMDVFIVRKLGVPAHEELAFGAIASGDIIVFNEEIVRELGLFKEAIDTVIQKEKKELKRREAIYRHNCPPLQIKNKVVILVDDGIATGATMQAAIQALKKLNPSRLVIAVPVAEKTTCEKMAKCVDQFVCPLQPSQFYAVGAWYENFDQTSDSEVLNLLDKKRG